MMQKNKNREVLTDLPISASSIYRTAEFAQGRTVLSLEINSIKNNKALTLAANILSLGFIDLKHGKNVFGASNILLDSTTIKVFNYTTESVLVFSSDHGLTISGETYISAAVGNDSALSISITSNGKTFTQSGIRWIGTAGAIEMEAVNTSMKNLSLVWDCYNYADPLWLFGDSYFSYYEARWPYYILPNYHNFLLSGFPGAPSSAMYQDFQTALTHGTPKMAVWCLGMNDPDPDSAINPEWKDCIECFITECEKRGITPILATIPNVPDRNHCHKNEYVKGRGFRYIDFASAVGANEKGSNWHDGMLSSDQVHPTVAGAQALAGQALLDFPEIKG